MCLVLHFVLLGWIKLGGCRLSLGSRQGCALQGLSGTDPCVDPSEKRAYILEPRLLQMLSSDGRRHLIWACAVHDNLQIVRQDHYTRIDVLRMCGEGARNDPISLANLLRRRVKNER